MIQREHARRGVVLERAGAAVAMIGTRETGAR
jgi:hypothetical protein